MRKLALLAAPLLALAALAGDGVSMFPSPRYEFSNCLIDGGAPQTVTAGTYIFRVLDADSRICINETANPDAGTVCGPHDGGIIGEMFPNGTVMKLTIPGTTSKYVSCSSSTATGDIYLTASP